MGKVAISEEYLTDIADSIREKLDSQDTYTVSKMSEAIDSIETGGGGLDWSAIGYNEPPQSVVSNYNYAKQIYNNWENVANLSGKFKNDDTLVIIPLVDTSNATDMLEIFYGCVNLKDVPLLDTSNVTSMSNMFSGCTALSSISSFNTSNCTNMQSMFYGCSNLTSIPLLETSKVTDIRSMFSGCSNIITIPQLNTSKLRYVSNAFLNCPLLSDESLNNILKMCININPNYSSTKSLTTLGIKSTFYSASRIQALPSYQDFIDAGWTIGF